MSRVRTMKSGRADGAPAKPAAARPMTAALRLGLLVAVLLVLGMPGLASVARADVLVTPDNTFYNRHSDECTVVDRSYYANSPSGSVVVRQSPGSFFEIGRLANGSLCNVYATYENKGQTWGVIMSGWPISDGWVLMDDMVVKYDYIAFYEEHAAEMYAYDGSTDWYEEGVEVAFYSWPGSGKVSFVVDISQFSQETIMFAYMYEDPEGNEWGYFNYFYGYRNLWVCLSDPANTEIAAFNQAPDIIIYPSDISGDQANPGFFSGTIWWLIIGLVVVLVAGSIVLIRVVIRPRRT